MKTLKEVATSLKISLAKASRIKRRIENDKYPNVPPYMIWGTGTRKNYNVDHFKKYLS